MTAHDDRARDEQDPALQDLVDQAQELNLYELTAAQAAIQRVRDLKIDGDTTEEGR